MDATPAAVGPQPPPEMLHRVERLLGEAPVEWRAARGGFSAAQRWSLTLADGRRAFAKLAPTVGLARFLRDEHRHMASFEADFRCRILAWDDGPRPLLVLEDLSDAHWPPDWRPGDVDAVRTTLARVAALPAPPSDAGGAPHGLAGG